MLWGIAPRCLAVIDPDGPVLGIEIRQAQVVVVRVLVGLSDLERSAENAAKDKPCLAVRPGFKHHVLELHLMPLVQTERVAVNLPPWAGFVFGNTTTYAIMGNRCYYIPEDVKTVFDRD